MRAARARRVAALLIALVALAAGLLLATRWPSVRTWYQALPAAAQTVSAGLRPVFRLP